MKLLQPKSIAMLERPTRLRIAAMRARGNKIQLTAVIATVGGLLALPEFAQAIGTGGAFAVALSNLLKARQ
jgi:hypothetical protein